MTPAATVLRLSVLLAAGLPPLAAWQRVAEASPVAQVVAEADGPERLPELIREATRERADALDWACVAAAWRVAADSGSPLAATLERLGEVLVAAEEARREAEVALAGPRATGRVVLALPAIGLLGGFLLGMDTLGVLATTPAGWCCLVTGGVLLAVARRWTRRLVASARRTDPTPGLAAELTAVALAGGGSAASALERVSSALAASGLPADDSATDTVGFAARAGVPAVALLRAEARDARRAAQAESRMRVAALGTRLLLPLGVCVLPAFVALGVAPVVLALLGSTLASF